MTTALAPAPLPPVPVALSPWDLGDTGEAARRGEKWARVEVRRRLHPRLVRLAATLLDGRADGDRAGQKAATALADEALTTALSPGHGPDDPVGTAALRALMTLASARPGPSAAWYAVPPPTGALDEPGIAAAASAAAAAALAAPVDSLAAGSPAGGSPTLDRPTAEHLPPATGGVLDLTAVRADQRAVLVLHDVERLTPGQAADVLAITPEQLRTELALARLATDQVPPATCHADWLRYRAGRLTPAEETAFAGHRTLCPTCTNDTVVASRSAGMLLAGLPPLAVVGTGALAAAGLFLRSPGGGGAAAAALLAVGVAVGLSTSGGSTPPAPPAPAPAVQAVPPAAPVAPVAPPPPPVSVSPAAPPPPAPDPAPTTAAPTTSPPSVTLVRSTQPPTVVPASPGIRQSAEVVSQVTDWDGTAPSQSPTPTP